MLRKEKNKPDEDFCHILANALGWRLQAIDYRAAQWLTAQQLAASEAGAAALQAKFGNL